MIGKIKVESPILKQDYEGNFEITFPVNKESNFAVKQIWSELKENKKMLSISIDFATKKRTLDQNALMWALLNEWAKEINGGRRIAKTSEDLYYEMLNKYGSDTMLFVKEEALDALKRVYKDVIVLNKHINKKQEVWCDCRCVIGSSLYTTEEMSNLIDGILDEMSEAEIETQNKRYLESEWRSYGR